MNGDNNKIILFHKNLSHVSLMDERSQQLFFENLLNETGLEIGLLEMILEEKVSPTVDRINSLVKRYDYITLYNVVPFLIYLDI